LESRIFPDVVDMFFHVFFALAPQNIAQEI
jgi:hypothetical protein